MKNFFRKISPRERKAILLLILVPLGVTLLLFLINKIMQPRAVVLTERTSEQTTSYININKMYAIDGDICIFPGELLSPNEFYNGSDIFGSREHYHGRSLKEVCDKRCLVGNDYVATLYMSIKLPANNYYSLLWPGEFCEYKVNVNGRTVASTITDDAKYIYPSADCYDLPYNQDGSYDIVINVKSPKEYPGSEFGSMLVGEREKLTAKFGIMRDFSMYIQCFVGVVIVLLLFYIAALKRSEILTAFLLYFTAAFCYAGTYGDFSTMASGLNVPYQVMLLLKSLAFPLYTAAILFVGYRLFPEVFPKKLVAAAEFLQVIPLISDLCLGRFPVLTVIAQIVLLLPFVPALYMFVQAYIRHIKYAHRYGVGVFLVEADILTRYLTSDSDLPVLFIYNLAMIAFLILNVQYLADKYKYQTNNEEFYREELDKYLNTLQDTENAFLNAQIKPHFLYNTLNTIADLCVTDSRKAQGLIDSLTEYLRLILDLDNMEGTVSLARELELANAYTAIEKERFPSINFYKDYPLKMPAIYLPPLTIQPLIENAIKHGVRKSDRPGAVTLRIVDREDEVLFFVSDNGVGMTDETIAKLFIEPKENKSIGIYNIDKRLKNHGSAGLTIESTVNLGSCVSFSIPK